MARSFTALFSFALLLSVTKIIDSFKLTPGHHADHPSVVERRLGHASSGVPSGEISSSWTRREILDVLTTITGATLAQPQKSLAYSGALSRDALSYNGVYSDPKHPKGYRVLIGGVDSATLTLQDDPNGSLLFNVPVKVDSKDGAVTRFTLDLSQKGGPTNIAGELGRDKEGIPTISFPDGNAWKKRETGPIGVYWDGSDPKKVMVLRPVKPPQLAVEFRNNGAVTSAGSAKAGGSAITFDLPDGKAQGVFSMRDKTLTFDDGVVWTKF